MKSKHLICKHKALALLGAFLFLLLSVPTVNAQEDQPEPSPCLDAMIGIVADFAILDKKIDPADAPNYAEVKADCKCILKEFPRLKGCSDMLNHKLVKVASDKSDERINLIAVDLPKSKTPEDRSNVESVTPDTGPVVYVHIEPLGDKTNCRMFSENNKYIIHSAPKPAAKNSILPPSEVAVSSDGDQKAARWDFVLIDDEDMKKGFYILTREKEPRALFRNGTQLDLKIFKHMDGKARALASWNFMVNGKDIEGNTRYVFRPQDSKNHVLGLDERTGRLLMVPTSVRATFTTTVQTRSAVGAKRKSAPNFPIFWKVECIF